MSYEFNADEVFEIAEQIERNGAKFYRTAAKNVSDVNNKNFCICLANLVSFV